jgi:PIN domain nuclease of toxin-antitoxin system
MRILIDTHIFLWAITDDPLLSRKYRGFYLDPNNELCLSVASLWEILIKVSVGRLAIPAPVVEYLTKQIERNRVTLLPVRMTHFNELEKLPLLHKDPFDRLLVAQARAEAIPLMTVDRALSKYRVKIL